MQRSIIVVKPPKAQMFLCSGKLLMVKLLRNRCYSADVFYFVFSSEMEDRTKVEMFLCGGQLLLVNLLSHRCYSGEVFLFCF